MPSVVRGAGLLIFGYATTWFVVSLILKRNDIADIAWGPGYIVLCVWLSFAYPADARDTVLCALVTLWGLRLAAHIAVRNRGKQEDFRYRKWREEWGSSFYVRSYLQVYLLQGAVLLVIGAPMLINASSDGPEIGLLDAFGIAVWLTGMVFETVSDYQLLSFKRKAGNRRSIIEHGLWRYSRHPNYFGEILVWIGIFLIGMPAQNGIFGLISPLMITTLLLFVSGIPMLEAKYRGDAAFEAYRARTSALVPMPPREQSRRAT